MVKALNRVVSITTLEVRVPSCPILRAITKLLTVVAEPSIIRMATSCSLRNPSQIAMGRKRIQNPNSLMAVAKNAGFLQTYFTAFFIAII